MNNRVNQIYEEYWSYTAAWTNINGKKFIKCLKMCVEFIDENNITSYDKALYETLQNQVRDEMGYQGKDPDLSARKGINQMVKIGFLKPYLMGYRDEAKEFLSANTDKKRQDILSRVVYRYSNFQNSITDPEVNTANQMQFLLRTLEEVGAIDKKALISLMTTDINEYTRGYLLKEELVELYNNACDIDFVDRKYNQLGHFLNLLGRMEDLRNVDGVIYFKTDAIRLFGDDEETRRAVRDPYLQRVYKSELEDESCIHYGSNTPKCMLEGLSHPVLIASHIKPYRVSEPEEAFDVNNGLLLSKNTDSLFDLGYMTFGDDGKIIPSPILGPDICNYLQSFSLHEDFRNEKRMKYMKYHRENVFNRRFSYNSRRYASPTENFTVAAEPQIIYGI